MKTMRRHKVLLALLFAVMLAFTVAAPAMAASACDNFRNCGGPSDCLWWAVRCAGSDLVEFLEITDAF